MIVPHYPPDLGPSAPLFASLAQELINRGHSIIIITSVPHYPSGIVPENFRKKIIQKEINHQMEIYRIRIPSVDRKKLGRRVLQFLVYQLCATWVGISKKYDIAFVANPALWVFLPFLFLCVLRRRPAVYSVYDVYPDVGIQLGIFKNKFIIKFVTFLERYCLNHARIVRIISESFKQGLITLGVKESKILLIHDWVDIDLIKPVPKTNTFSVTNNLSNKFIVLYAGNLGLSQGLEILLQVAMDFNRDPEILFLFVGDGSGRTQLMEEVEKLQLRNIRFIPFQPRELLPQVLASADISLVVLKKGIGFNSIPSKILSILASNRPIIASIDESSEGWKLIEKANAGICVPPEEPKLITKAIFNLRDNDQLREQFGNNGREWVVYHHSPKIAANLFEELFMNILKSKF